MDKITGIPSAPDAPRHIMFALNGNALSSPKKADIRRGDVNSELPALTNNGSNSRIARSGLVIISNLLPRQDSEPIPEYIVGGEDE